MRNSGVAMGFEESTVETFSVSAEERERTYQKAWDEGGGFRFMFETFCDIATDSAANEEAAKFIRRKIAEIVTDPETRRNLTPTDLYARRPLCDSGYYQTFNRPNVTLVNIKENPITRVTEHGVLTAGGTLHELDVLVCATGFDAVDGNYMRIDIRGRDRQSLKDHWSDGPASYLGMATSGFPNMFMILGPNGPFTNLPPSIETQVDWIADAIRHVSATDDGWIDVKPDTEAEWTATCTQIANQTLFPQAASWIFGANIPGKKRTVMFYLGGIKQYRSFAAAESSAGLSRLHLERRHPHPGLTRFRAGPGRPVPAGVPSPARRVTKEAGMTKYATVDPTTGKVVAGFATMQDAEVEQALARAASAYRPWRETGLAGRAAVLSRVGTCTGSTRPNWPS